MCFASRASPVHTAVRNCTRDEGRPFGFGDQVADPKPPRAAAVKSRGGERRGKRRDDDPGRQGRERRAQANRRQSVEIAKTMSELGAGTASGISSGDVLILPGRHPACRRREARSGSGGNVRTWPAMPREKAQAAPTARPKVPKRRRGADCLVVARSTPAPPSRFS
jgi:hypothetical protein